MPQSHQMSGHANLLFASPTASTRAKASWSTHTRKSAGKAAWRDREEWSSLDRSRELYHIQSRKKALYLEDAQTLCYAYNGSPHRIHRIHQADPWVLLFSVALLPNLAPREPVRVYLEACPSDQVRVLSTCNLISFKERERIFVGTLPLSFSRTFVIGYRKANHQTDN